MLTAFAISVGVMCGLSTLLALVAVIAEATIGNYGEVQVTINGRRELKVRGGKPLLSTLKEQGIFIPSACGGRGSCGLCKVSLPGGGGSPAPTELPWLTGEEQKAGVRLSCQLKVKKDLRIAIPEELFSVRQYQAEVASIRDLTHDIKEVRLKLLEPAQMDFVPGQFVQLEVPPYELTDEPVYRAYSISGDSRVKDAVELEIRYVPNGICTTYVHRRLKKGDRAVINGPYGDFCLRSTDRDIIFIAGGSGMAPIKSILHEMAHAKNPRKAAYVFGARSRRDLFLVDEMKALEAQLPRFEFIPALSNPLPADQWQGESGLVTEVVERRFGDLGTAEAYLCGSPLMIDACIAVLKKKGMPEDLIYYDKFA